MYEAARTRSVDSRVDKTKRGIEGLSYPVSRISGEGGVHGEALCQVSSRLVVVVGPFLTKQETHMRTSIAPSERIALGYQVLGNRRDVSVPFLPISDWQEYCFSDCYESMRRDLPSFGKATLKNSQHS